MYQSAFIATSLFCISILGCQPVETTPASDMALRSGVYPDDALPGSSPQLFATDLVSTDLNERDAAFSSDGNLFYYTLMVGAAGTIVEVKKEQGKWLAPEIASFSGTYSDLEPFITPDGQRLYFVSNRPVNESDEVADYDIWYTNKVDGGWGEPVNLGPPVNTEANEFYPSLTAEGTIYFTVKPTGASNEDLFSAVFSDGAFQKPERLPDAINTDFDEFNALVDPAGQYILFSSYGRPDGLGGGDLYVSFKDDDETWLPAVNLGPTINSSGLDYCPAVTPDGAYFVFSSRRSNQTDTPRQTYQEMMERLRRPGNGAGDLYWMEMEPIRALK